jgi:hypothetical protein
MNHEIEQPNVIPLRAQLGNDSQQPMVTRQVSHPFVTWRVPGGPCRRAWIERTQGQAGVRFLFSDAIDGNAIGEPISAPVCHDMADLETLQAYVWATLEPGR